MAAKLTEISEQNETTLC